MNLHLMQQKFIVTKEKPVYGTNVAVSVKGHWKSLPPLLHKLKQHNCSIHKAKYWQECTSMYIKTPHDFTYDTFIGIASSIDLAQEKDNLYSPGLPFNTSIYLYNIQTSPYTVLDFGCLDRTGLFCETLEVLSLYDIEIQGAYINTIGNIVNNIFFITHNNKQLTDKYIEYIRNNLESEVKMQDNSY